MQRPIIEDLEWDDENEAHLDRHLDPEIVHEMIEGQDWVHVRNKKKHPPEYVRLIGRHKDQSMITVILAPTHRANVWRPVTAFWASREEANLYNRVRRKNYVH
jgi:hypothetical protein